ncbi:hypothetical protein [Arsenicibacter rosenii]|uniref:Uncharacterized protein n=1 Tax=Arsenicibacter rosenii TaxID=1750698 RepID=A0A1S2VK35_9BACT|nr:hypothetical protein [Arsenicibacter rosenii]OIN58585.1 hypothetical protein BLX24_13515 [Arsenicibacter rosenii]
MYETREHLQTLTEIRSLMERSSKFLSLSGLSGVFAGVVALMGAAAVYWRLDLHYTAYTSYDGTQILFSDAKQDIVRFLMLDGFIVLLVALIGGSLFTIRKARKQGMSIWNTTSKRLLQALFTPLLAGGVFCLGLIHHDLIWLVFPATLVFYGLALLSASRYTVRDLHYLGICEIVLGLLSLFLTGYSLLTWAFGFGVLHIVYGMVMYFKYDAKPENETGVI